MAPKTRAALTAEQHKKKGRYANAGWNLVGAVFTALFGALAFLHASPEDPPAAQLATVLAVLTAASLRTLASLRPAGSKRRWFTLGAAVLYLVVWIAVKVIRPDLFATITYTIATLAQLFPFLGMAYQDDHEVRAEKVKNDPPQD